MGLIIQAKINSNLYKDKTISFCYLSQNINTKYPLKNIYKLDIKPTSPQQYWMHRELTTVIIINVINVVSS